MTRRFSSTTRETQCSHGKQRLEELHLEVTAEDRHRWCGHGVLWKYDDSLALHRKLLMIAITHIHRRKAKVKMCTADGHNRGHCGHRSIAVAPATTAYAQSTPKYTYIFNTWGKGFIGRRGNWQSAFDGRVSTFCTWRTVVVGTSRTRSPTCPPSMHQTPLPNH